MALIKLKPTSPGRRADGSRSRRRGCTRARRMRALTEAQCKTGGRNHYGRITTRHQGGGSKQHYRIIDFKRDKEGIACRVERLEYDPNRTAHIALLCYVDGERRYIIAPKGVEVGDQLMAGRDAPIKAGNALPLRNIPVGADRALRRDEAGQGRAAGAQRRRLGAAGRARGRLRDLAPALRRDAQGSCRLPRDDRRGRQFRAQPAQARQGRRQALARHPPDGARRGDESGRSSARRRRRPRPGRATRIRCRRGVSRPRVTRRARTSAPTSSSCAIAEVKRVRPDRNRNRKWHVH